MPEGIPTGGAAPTAGAGAAVAEPVVTYGGGDTGADNGTSRNADRQSHSDDAVDRPAGEVGGDETGGGSDQDFAEGFDDFDADEEIAPKADGEINYQALKQALAQNPELFKQVKKAVSISQRLSKIPNFETPEKVAQAAEKIETLGGLEGIERETAEAATLWNMLGAGDAGVLDALERDGYGEGLAKLAPAVLDRWQKSDPEGWNHSMASIFMATANQSGLVTALSALYDVVGENPSAKKFLDRISGVIESIQGHASKAPAPKAQDDKLAKERQELAQQKNALYQRDVSTKVAPVIKNGLQNNLAPLLKGKNLSPDAKKYIMRQADTHFAEIAKKDLTFQQNFKAALTAGETDKCIRLLNSLMERTGRMAARNAWRDYAGISGYSDKQAAERKTEGQSRRESAGGGAAVNTIKTQTPKGNEIDWQRMRAEFGREGADDMFMFQRQFYKKGDSKNRYSY